MSETAIEDHEGSGSPKVGDSEEEKEMQEELAASNENEKASEPEEEEVLDFNQKLQAAIQVRIKSRFSLR